MRSDRGFPWYDAQWLTDYVRAKAIIRETKPEALESFVRSLEPLRTRADFSVVQLDRVFDDETLGQIKGVVAGLKAEDLELHEARRFGRFIVHNHPLLAELHQRVVPLVSERVGEPVECAYTFLSLYGARGVCPAHMDAPEAKWTLDVCISQNVSWPIYLSQVEPWPEALAMSAEQDWEEKVKDLPSLRYTPYTLQPGQAIIFSGSSQWHYRDVIPEAGGRQFCDLLFFHFIPAGMRELVDSHNWSRLFGIPAIGPA